MPFMGFIVTCQGPAEEGDTAKPHHRRGGTEPPSTLHPRSTRGGGARPHWQQLHFSASASVPSPPLHTQSLAHFSHSAGQQEQQPADKIGSHQSDGLSLRLSPSKGRGTRRGARGLVARPVGLSIRGLSVACWATKGDECPVSGPQPRRWVQGSPGDGGVVLDHKEKSSEGEWP